MCAHLYISVSPASKGGFKTLRPERRRQPLMLLSPLACVFRGTASYLLPLCCRRGGRFMANSVGRHWASPAAPRHPSSLSPQTNALRSSYYFLACSPQRFKLSLALTRARRTRSVFYGPVRGRTRAPVRCGVSGSDYPRGEAMLPLCSDVKCLVNWKRAQLISLLHTSSGRLPAILPPVAV